MKQLTFSFAAFGFLCAILLILGAGDVTKQEILTVYNASGQVTGQSENNPGWHRVMDTVTLDDDAAVIVTLNTSTALGYQDVSFQSQTSYGGYAWSISDGRTIFTITPIDGHSFWVASSDTTARHTVYYLVEGQ